ncbi:MAG: 30S ribosomal protein S6 [Chloroflexota bacterium]|nr:30S ribosomal protein S6 [Chloroflexota bacterium]
MRDYELVVIVNPSVADDDVTTILEKVNTLITERGGSIAEVNQWGRKKLAHPIKKATEGNYALMKFNMDPKLAAELEASLELSEDIIRYMLIRLGN